MMRSNRLPWTLGVLLGVIAVNLVVWGALIYTAVHFIKKFW